MSYLNKIAKPIGTYHRDDQIAKMDNILYKYIAKMVYNDEEIEPRTTYLLNIPLTTDTFVYDGTVKTPTWTGFDNSIMAISGDTSATNAGNHTVIFTLIDNRYSWLDGTNTPKQVTWSIEQADNVITFAANPFTIAANDSQVTTFSTLSSAATATVGSGYDTNITEVTNGGENKLNVEGHSEGTVDVPLIITDLEGNYKPASATLTVNVTPALTPTYLSNFTVPSTAESFRIMTLT